MFAMICANNVNRSTEAHDHLHAAGLRVCSFGAGNKVRALRFSGRRLEEKLRKPQQKGNTHHEKNRSP